MSYVWFRILNVDCGTFDLTGVDCDNVSRLGLTAGEGAPFNVSSAMYGTVLQLPQTWWRTFPAARRRMRDQRTLGTH